MARGATAEIGTIRVAKNGYHYTKTEDGTWRLTHHLTAEAKLGRPLTDNELVKIKDKSRPYDQTNIMIIPKKTASLRRRAAQLEARIADLQSELDYLHTLIEAQR